MREIRRSALVAASPERMFDVINDVEHYPDFVPGCSAASVLERGPDMVRARLAVGHGLFSTAFVTRNRLHRPFAIDLELDEGPFRSLSGRWTLTPINAGDLQGCRVELLLRFELQGGVTGMALGPLMERVASALVDAFVARAGAAQAGPR